MIFSPDSPVNGADLKILQPTARICKIAPQFGRDDQMKFSPGCQLAFQLPRPPSFSNKVQKIVPGKQLVDIKREDSDAKAIAVDNTGWPDGVVRCR
jgi:hypothetical protein